MGSPKADAQNLAVARVFSVHLTTDAVSAILPRSTLFPRNPLVTKMPVNRVRIRNFKSVQALDLSCGVVTVIIGPNGSGKSNVLEAIAAASAASDGKLDNEFLSSRGIRVTDPRFMRSAFASPPRSAAANSKRSRKITPASFDDLRPLKDGEVGIAFDGVEERPYSTSIVLSYDAKHNRWASPLGFRLSPDAARNFANALESLAKADKVGAADPSPDSPPFETPDGLVKLSATRDADGVMKIQLELVRPSAIRGFMIYSPEHRALRSFQSEGQVLPLGIHGEGLLSHLESLEGTDTLKEVSELLTIVDWFGGIELSKHGTGDARVLLLRDKYLWEQGPFDQRSANEGFLFLLFYFVLVCSPHTPKFFAIDNLDAALNPKLCRTLMSELVRLAKAHNKQILVTTHNPALLDGLDLTDPGQQLAVVSRDLEGRTVAKRIKPMTPLAGDLPIPLSEAFLRGYIGGLPKNF